MGSDLEAGRGVHPVPVVLGAGRLTIEDVCALARRERPALLASDDAFRTRIDAGAQFLDALLAREGNIYGVTTGYGDSCETSIPLDLVEELPRHLYTFHGCGLGATLSAVATRAVLVARLNSLAQGVSGVRYELLDRLTTMLQQDVLPRIPEEGSVGASGDLTPLSYVAAVLAGEREVIDPEGGFRPTAEVFAERGIQPLTLRPKEGLAIMNGTAVMTGLACLAFERADDLLRLATRITAMMVVATDGNPDHFDARLFAAKPHPGQLDVASWLRVSTDPQPELNSFAERRVIVWSFICSLDCERMCCSRNCKRLCCSRNCKRGCCSRNCKRLCCSLDCERKHCGRQGKHCGLCSSRQKIFNFNPVKMQAKS